MRQLLVPEEPAAGGAPLDLDGTSVALLHLVWLLRRQQQQQQAGSLPELAPLVRQLADAVQAHLPAASPKHLAEQGWALGELQLAELAPGHPVVPAWLQVRARLALPPSDSPAWRRPGAHLTTRSPPRRRRLSPTARRSCRLRSC
jgi:hypothetical protein